jgi:hypothetical protein
VPYVRTVRTASCRGLASADSVLPPRVTGDQAHRRVAERRQQILDAAGAVAVAVADGRAAVKSRRLADAVGRTGPCYVHSPGGKTEIMRSGNLR